MLCRYIKKHVGTFTHNDKQYSICSKDIRKVFFTSWGHLQSSSVQGQVMQGAQAAITMAAGNSPQTVQMFYSFSNQPLESAMQLMDFWREFTMSHPIPQPMLPLTLGVHEEAEQQDGDDLHAADEAGPSTAAADEVMDGPDSEESYQDSGSDGEYEEDEDAMECVSDEDDELEVDVSDSDEE
jgi:hypothetical protein